MVNNSKNQIVQTEKALWNDTTQEAAYHFLEDARDGSSKSEEPIKYENYDQSDDSETKERDAKAKHDAKYDNIKLQRRINTEEEKVLPRKRENSESPTTHMKILDEEITSPDTGNKTTHLHIQTIRQKKIKNRILSPQPRTPVERADFNLQEPV